MSDNQLTYKIHDVLNPVVWEEGAIKPEIRRKLINLAYFWLQESTLPQSMLQDIILTGSSAGYNYTKYSDIDLHLIVDKDVIGCEKIVDDYLFDKKKIFGENHNIKIENHDVEVYAQDYREKFPKGESVYSLLNEKWIIKPKKEKVNLSNPKLLKKARYYKKLVKFLIAEGNIKKMMKFKEKIRKMRQSGLDEYGEFAPENIVYKELRNLGLLEKLNDRLNYLIDKRYSI